MGPIPLHTGWTLGSVPEHISNWAKAAQQRAVAQAAYDAASSMYLLPGFSNRARTVRAGGAMEALPAGVTAATAATAAAAADGGLFGPTGARDPVLAGITTGMPDASLPLVPGADETFVSRDTGVTGQRGFWSWQGNTGGVRCGMGEEGGD